MARDDNRIESVSRALDEAGLDAIICALPANVLLLSGYWPVAGAAVAIATREGRTVVIAPKDEMELAARALADEVRNYRPGSLDEAKSVAEALWLPLREAAVDLSVERGRIGYERGPSLTSAPYAAMQVFGVGLIDLLRRALPDARLRPGDEMLARLQATPTPMEAKRIRAACRIAGRAYLEGARQLRAGMKEYEAAALFRGPLGATDYQPGVQRADGFTFCLSGANSANAHAAYARSRDREIATGDLVMVHCNSYADGYWTDITRTFVLDEADERKLEMYGAVFAALHAALGAIRPGARAADVDAAARATVISRGFGEHFKHATGHGVGFAAIDPNAPPRLRPASDDMLEEGMIFSVEPAIYVENYGGLRHCEMALVTETGAEVLTPFQSSIDQLVIGSSGGDGLLEAETAAAPATVV
ncbi:MAG: M24 family metallopeptidase [Blastocatellia bacterium]